MNTQPNLSVVAPIECHPLVPKILEEWRQDFIFNILRLNAVCCTTLFDDLQYNFLHFLIRRLELTDQDQHHLTCVVVGILSIHQWDQIANSLPTMPTTVNDDIRNKSSASAEVADRNVTWYVL